MSAIRRRKRKLVKAEERALRADFPEERRWCRDMARRRVSAQLFFEEVQRQLDHFRAGRVSLKQVTAATQAAFVGTGWVTCPRTLSETEAA